MRILAVILTAGMAVAVCGASVPGSAVKTSPQGTKYTIATVAKGLSIPWSLAFLPDGTMLVTEREGRLRAIRNGELDPSPIEGVPEVYAQGQGGLFEVLPHPDYAENKLLYLSYAHGTLSENRTRVARARFDGTALRDLEVIFDATPPKDTPVHYGGRMTFLADGTLLLTLGDGFQYRERAQKLNTDLGKIVRINQDGSIPKDNPFTDRKDAKGEIWTYGHRNVQGIFFDAQTGRVYAHEHGPRGGDELNLIEKGKNYGWPVITYGVDYTGAVISPYKEYEGMEQPLIYWVPSIAPSGMTLYRGSVFPGWAGDIFISALAGKKVQRVNLENGRVIGEETLFDELDERIRDIRSGPDGRLYLLTDAEPTKKNPVGGRVLRVDPAR